MSDLLGALRRLLARVEVDEAGCWVVTRGTAHGYARVWYRGGNAQGHRVSYAVANGLELDEMPHWKIQQVDHRCRVRPCINPLHLALVTPAENIARADGCAGQWQAAKTHCAEGHRYTPENTRIRANGHRVCRTCHRIRESARYHAGKKGRRL